VLLKHKMTASEVCQSQPPLLYAVYSTNLSTKRFNSEIDRTTCKDLLAEIPYNFAKKLIFQNFGHKFNTL